MVAIATVSNAGLPHVEYAGRARAHVTAIRPAQCRGWLNQRMRQRETCTSCAGSSATGLTPELESSNSLQQQPQQLRQQQQQSALQRHCIVLDFDGVLLDSEGEVTQAALNTAGRRWPHLFSNLSSAQLEQLADDMRRVRPVLVRGYEALVMARLLLEDSGAVQSMLDGWGRMLPAAIARWGEDSDDMATQFEAERNAWMTERSGSWLALHAPYPGVQQAYAACPFPLFLATSKGNTTTGKDRVLLWPGFKKLQDRAQQPVAQ
ncbi:hypothetical protein QJQ45_001355 [Haematococcus lacustris]|nr:hypothetical protein QJQ45_001355 [Haematococcus lacustris]